MKKETRIAIMKRAFPFLIYFLRYYRLIDTIPHFERAINCFRLNYLQLGKPKLSFWKRVVY